MEAAGPGGPPAQLVIPPHSTQRQTGKHTAFIETSSLQETPGQRPSRRVWLALPEDQACRQRRSGQAVGVLGCSAFPKKSAAWAETEQGPAELWPLLTSRGTRALYLISGDSHPPGTHRWPESHSLFLPQVGVASSAARRGDDGGMGGWALSSLSPPKPFPRGPLLPLFTSGPPKAQRQARAPRSAEDFGVLLPTPSFTQGPGKPLLTQRPRAQRWPQLPIGPWGEMEVRMLSPSCPPLCPLLGVPLSLSAGQSGRPRAQFPAATPQQLSSAHPITWLAPDFWVCASDPISRLQGSPPGPEEGPGKAPRARSLT